MSRVHAALAKKDWSVLHVSERASAYAAAHIPSKQEVIGCCYSNAAEPRYEGTVTEAVPMRQQQQPNYAATRLVQCVRALTSAESMAENASRISLSLTSTTALLRVATPMSSRNMAPRKKARSSP